MPGKKRPCPSDPERLCTEEDKNACLQALELYDNFVQDDIKEFNQVRITGDCSSSHEDTEDIKPTLSPSISFRSLSSTCDSVMVKTDDECATTSSKTRQRGKPRKCQHNEGGLCTKLSQGRTPFCARHGGGRRCETRDCGKLAQGSTPFCAAHGGGRRCQHAGGCGKSAAGSTQFCKAHGGGKRCHIGGCSKSAQGSTLLCMAHGGGRRCLYDHCDKIVITTTNFCRQHGGTRECRVKGCKVAAHANTPVCRAHRSTFGTKTSSPAVSGEQSNCSDDEPASSKRQRMVSTSSPSTTSSHQEDHLEAASVSEGSELGEQISLRTCPRPRGCLVVDVSPKGSQILSNNLEGCDDSLDEVSTPLNLLSPNWDDLPVVVQFPFPCLDPEHERLFKHVVNCEMPCPAEMLCSDYHPFVVIDDSSMSELLEPLGMMPGVKSFPKVEVPPVKGLVGSAELRHHTHIIALQTVCQSLQEQAPLVKIADLEDLRHQISDTLKHQRLLSRKACMYNSSGWHPNLMTDHATSMHARCQPMVNTGPIILASLEC